MKMNWLGKMALGAMGVSIASSIIENAVANGVQRAHGRTGRKIECPKCEGCFDVDSLTCEECGWEYHG